MLRKILARIKHAVCGRENITGTDDCPPTRSYIGVIVGQVNFQLHIVRSVWGIIPVNYRPSVTQKTA